PMTLSGRVPGGRARTIRWAAGSGGYVTLYSLGALLGLEVLSALSTVWLAVTAAVVLLRHPRGLSGYASGLTVVDARGHDLVAGRPRGVDPRGLGQAVVALVAIGFIVGTSMSAVGTLSPTVEFGIAAVGVLVL